MAHVSYMLVGRLSNFLFYTLRIILPESPKTFVDNWQNDWSGTEQWVDNFPDFLFTKTEMFLHLLGFNKACRRNFQWFIGCHCFANDRRVFGVWDFPFPPEPDGLTIIGRVLQISVKHVTNPPNHNIEMSDMLHPCGFNLFKHPYRKPTQQQPFHNHLSQ